MTRGDGRITTASLDVSIKSGAIIGMFEKAPQATFLHLREAMWDIFDAHRKSWLERTRVKFRNRGMSAAKMGRKDNERPWFSDKQFFFFVHPRNRRPKNPNLADIKGEAYTRSDAALGMEVGGTFRPKKQFLAIPIGHALNKLGIPKPGFSSPEALQKHGRSVNKETIVFKRDADAPMVYLIDRLGGKRKDGTRRVKRKVLLKPIFLLVRQVTLRPKLKFMDTWEEMSAKRTKRLGLAMTRIVDDMVSGRLRPRG